MLLYIWIATIFAALWLYFRRLHSRFSRYGVKDIPPIPLLGNQLPLFRQKEHLVEQLDRIYKAFPEEKFVGRWELMNPTLIPRDIELIKKITIKDFEYFIDHRSMVDENNDPFFGRNLFTLKGSRFALCEVKVVLYQLVLQMEMSPCAKTCVPSRVTRDAFNFSLHGGHWVRLKMRT